MIIFDHSPQGSEAWLAKRRGVITGSRFKQAREKVKSGAPSAKAEEYALDLARERCGGTAPGAFVNAAMRMGTEQEPLARADYEESTGMTVVEAGFAHTPDRWFGCSVDGLVGDDGIIEIKTLVSSQTLFKTLVNGDISDYLDQCYGALWLLKREWIDLILWAPDLAALGRRLTVLRIQRDEAVIAKLQADLYSFRDTVAAHQNKLLTIPATFATNYQNALNQ